MHCSPSVLLRRAAFAGSGAYRAAPQWEPAAEPDKETAVHVLDRICALAQAYLLGMDVDNLRCPFPTRDSPHAVSATLPPNPLTPIKATSNRRGKRFASLTPARCTAPLAP